MYEEKLIAVFLFTFMCGIFFVSTTSLGATEFLLGDEIQYSDWYYYEILNENGNGTGEVLVKYAGTDLAVSVPAAIDDYIVVGLANDAFAYNETVKTIDCTGTTHLRFIGESAFRGCSYLTTVMWNEDMIEEIQPYAFIYCERLTTVNLPTNPKYTEISANLFEDCALLRSITTLPSNVQKIDEYAFNETGITEMTIPDNVVAIGEGVFSDCSVLSKLVLPKNALMTEIPPKFVSRCLQLKTLDIPVNYLSIGNDAFWSSGLEKITIPNTIAYIGEGAFNYCSDLSFVQFLGEVPSIKSDNSFNTDAMTTYVIPVGKKSQYETALKAAGALDTCTYMESDEPITVIPVVSTEYGKGIILTGKLFKGRPLSNVAIKGTFVDSVTKTVINGTLSWANPLAKYEAGCFDVSWVFTPTQKGVLAITGVVSADVLETLSTPAQPSLSFCAVYRLSVTWDKVNNADGYEVYLAKGNGAFTRVANTTAGQYKFANLSVGTKYKIKIRAYANAAQKEYSAYSAVLSASTMGIKPGKTVIRKLKKKKKTITVTWKKLGNVSGYQICYSTNKSKGYKKKTAKASETSLKIKKLKTKRTYYVKIRTYKILDGTTWYGDYSSIKKIKL